MGFDLLEAAFKGVWEKVKALFKQAEVWFVEDVEPEAKQFIEDNRPLIESTIKQIALTMVGAASAAKKEAAMKAIGIGLANKMPDLVVKDRWISLGIEIIYSILKAQNVL